jgi:hypothetical protein
MDRFTTTVGATLAMISQFLYTYDEDAGHIVCRVWKINFKRETQINSDNATPSKIFKIFKIYFPYSTNYMTCVFIVR